MIRFSIDNRFIDKLPPYTLQNKSLSTEHLHFFSTLSRVTESYGNIATEVESDENGGDGG